MKMRKKGFVLLIAVLVACNMMIPGIESMVTVVEASEDEDNQNDKVIPKIIPTKSIPVTEAEPGEKVHMVIPVRMNQHIESQVLSIESEDSHLEVSSDITISNPFNVEPVKIESFGESLVEFDVTIKETTKIGKYKLTLKASGTDIYADFYNDITLDLPIEIKVTKEKADASLYVNSLVIPDSVKPGEEFEVSFFLKNIGGLTAKETTILVEGYSPEGVVPNYSRSKIQVGDIKSSREEQVILKLKAAEATTGGYTTLTLKINSKDEDAKEYLTDIPIYINILGGNASDGDPNIVISDVTQSISSPTAGGKVTLSFNLANKSSGDIKEVKITPTNLTNTNFSPIKSEPYQYIKSIKKGGKKKVNMNLIVSKKVVEGLNELEISYTYKDENGKLYGPTTAKLFVLNVLNPEDEGSTPKLIISDFKVSEEKLKAGSTFDYHFTVLNTNSKVAAKNIKVTLSSTDNVFSVTKGSNSFYIPIIKAGETKDNALNLKIKPDSVTKSYPFEIKFEYEYDDMPVAKDGTVTPGVTVSETINLQVMENARPVVSNIVVGYGEPPITNSVTTLNFDFYNLGKSALSNVTAKIESADFDTTSTMLFIGNVEAGSGDMQEIEVTPMIEGQAKGTLIISYEDSNGDTIEVPTEFEAMVEPMPTFDPGSEDIGMNPEAPVTKEPIVNTIVFVLIQIVIFVIAFLVGKKLTISLYKKKLRKEEEKAF